MDNLKSIVIAQIKKTSQEIEAAKAEAVKQTEEEQRKAAAEREIYLKSAELLFNHRRDIVENSGVRKILEFIVQCLNSSDEDFSSLKESVLKMINENPHNSADKNTQFFVVSDSFCDSGDYHIYIKIDGCSDYLMDISSSDSDDNDFLCINRSLYNHRKNSFLNYVDNSKSIVHIQQIINFLMTD